MVGDVQRIMNAAAKIHEVWAAVLETGLATWLLYRQIGPGCFVMLGIATGEFSPLIKRPQPKCCFKVQ